MEGNQKAGSAGGPTLDYFKLIQATFNNRGTLIKMGSLGLLLGVLIAFTTPKEYQSSSYILLESDGSPTSSMGQLGALAGLAGINMSQLQGGQMSLTSDIFPDVIQSRDFLLAIGKEEFIFESKEGIKQTLEEYYFEEKPSNIVKKTLNFVFGIPYMITGWFSSPDPLPTDFGTSAKEIEKDYLNLSGKEIFAVGELKKRILIEQKGKMIRLNVSMPEPVIAAEVNAKVLDRLIEYVTEYKVGRQRRNLEFIEDRVKESEQKFNEAQMRLASFRDSNQGVISRRVMTREEQLEFELNIAYNIFNSLKQELEQSAIQLKKETPIFTVLEKASIPLGASKPNKPLILIFSIFLGVFIGILINVFNILKENFNAST